VFFLYDVVTSLFGLKKVWSRISELAEGQPGEMLAVRLQRK
jgi:uncharacterized membrane protein YuzA (DUF378 family)